MVYRIETPDVVVEIVTSCDDEYVPPAGLNVGVATCCCPLLTLQLPTWAHVGEFDPEDL